MISKEEGKWERSMKDYKHSDVNQLFFILKYLDISNRREQKSAVVYWTVYCFFNQLKQRREYCLIFINKIENIRI